MSLRIPGIRKHIGTATTKRSAFQTFTQAGGVGVWHVSIYHVHIFLKLLRFARPSNSPCLDSSRGHGKRLWHTQMLGQIVYTSQLGCSTVADYNKPLILRLLLRISVFHFYRLAALSECKSPSLRCRTSHPHTGLASLLLGCVLRGETLKDTFSARTGDSFKPAI